MIKATLTLVNNSPAKKSLPPCEDEMGTKTVSHITTITERNHHNATIIFKIGLPKQRSGLE